MKKYTLNAQKRTIIGKKVKNLRKTGLIPANVFGKKVKSQAVQLTREEFNKVFKEAGETSIVDLVLEGTTQPILIHQPQIHPVTNEILHVDLFHVDLKEKVKTHVPVEFTGEAPAVAQKLGIILELLNEIEVETLPLDLPEKIVVDLSTLKAEGDTIKIADIKLPANVTAITNPESEVVKIGSLVTKEAEKLAAEEEAAKAAAAAATAATTTTPAEGTATATTEAPKVEGATAAPAETPKAPPAGK